MPNEMMPLFGGTVPQGTPQVTPGSAPGQGPQTWDEFGAALADFLGFADKNPLNDDEENDAAQADAESEFHMPGGPFPPRESPYVPRASANVIDQESESPEVPEEAKQRITDDYMNRRGRFGPDAKTAAARVSLMPRGVVPFLAAAYDMTTGNNPRGLNMSGLYRKHQLEADILTSPEGEGPAANMVRDYAPAAIGMAVGALAPAKTLAGTMARGGAAGGAYSGTDAYFAPSNEDLDSPRRIQRGLAGTIPGALLGAGTAGMGGAARGLASNAIKASGERSQRTAREAIIEQRGRMRRNEQTEAQRIERKAPVQRPPEEEGQLAQLYSDTFSRKPKDPSPNWEKSLKVYSQDRAGFIQRRINAGRDIESISRELNVSPAQIARTIDINKIVPKDSRYQQVIEDTVTMLDAERAFKKTRISSTTPKPKEPTFEDKAGESVRNFSKQKGAELREGLAGLKAKEDSISRRAPHWQKGVFPPPVRRPQAEAPAQQPAPAAPQTKAATAAEPTRTASPATKPRSPMGQMEFRRFNNSRSGKESWREIQGNTRRAQLDADAQATKDLTNPRSMREVLKLSGKNPVQPSGKTVPAGGKVIQASGQPKAKYAPESRRGLFDVTAEVSEKYGKPIRDLPREGVEELVQKAAKHTDLKPSDLRRILKTYGQADEGKATRAKRGIGARRIRELMEGERTRPKGKDTD